MLNIPLIVETDASDYAIAGILSIVCPDSEICPVVFYSRTLTPPELNYNTHDKAYSSKKRCLLRRKDIKDLQMRIRYLLWTSKLENKYS
jgi:hypothetical protein